MDIERLIIAVSTLALATAIGIACLYIMRRKSRWPTIITLLVLAVFAGLCVRTIRYFVADIHAADVIEANGAYVGMPTPDVNVSFVDIGHGYKGFGDTQLAAIAVALDDVPDFAGLQLSHTSVSDNGLRSLQNVIGLQRLYIDETPITATGLLQLRKLPNLKLIWHAHGQFSDADLKMLKTAMPAVQITDVM